MNFRMFYFHLKDRVGETAPDNSQLNVTLNFSAISATYLEILHIKLRLSFSTMQGYQKKCNSHKNILDFLFVYAELTK